MPRTVVPGAPDGLMVTLMTAVWPGQITTGANGVAGLTAVSMASPPGEVTAESNSLVSAVIKMLAVPAGGTRVRPALAGPGRPLACRDRAA